MAKQLILVDGSSYLHRAYHAFDKLTGPDGQSTGAIYGVVRMLMALEKSYSADYFAVIFDAPGKTFRNDIYPEYKAHRPPTPPDLKEQFAGLLEIVAALGYPVIQKEGVEADDVIGTLAVQASKKKMDVLISTGDKDLAQLVTKQVSLLDTMKKKKEESLTSSAEQVEAKFGVRPEQIAEYLALAGDTSDGIPGVPGVGAKTAAKWLQTYESLDGLIQHADEIKTKAGESLRDTIPMLKTYLELTTIDCKVTLEQSPTDLVRSEQDQATLATLYKQYGFSSLLREQGIDAPATSEQSAPAGTPATSMPVAVSGLYRLVLSDQTLDDCIKRLQKAKQLVIDVVVDSEQVCIDTQITGIGLASDAEAFYIPLAHDYEYVAQQLDCPTCLKKIKALLDNDKITKYAHDVKTLTHALSNHDVTIEGTIIDTMLVSYVYDSDAANQNLVKLAQTYVDLDIESYEDMAGKGSKQQKPAQVPLRTMGEYCAQRSAAIFALQTFFDSQAGKRRPLGPILDALEMPLLPVLTQMERSGVLIDTKALDQQSAELHKAMIKTEKEAHAFVGEFNMGSTKQVREVLYDKLGFTPPKKTPKGEPSTDEESLQQLALEHDLPRLILEHRSLSKLKSTYTDVLPTMVNTKTGRIHTTYHQAVTATGRLSSSNPNLQNIPIRTEAGRRVRQAFIARPKHQLVAIDYSQIEMRVVAHLSGDTNLCKQFKKGADIHQSTAAEVFDIKPEKVGNDERRVAKAINFGLIYGMSAFGLAKQLGIERSEASSYIEKYFERYPAVRQFMDDTKQLVHDKGYVETLNGRRIYVPHIESKNPALKRYAERMAINAPVQGSAADIIKRAMIDIAADLPAKMLLIMQIHDELVLEVPQAQVEQAIEYCSDKMSAAANLDVPLTVSAGSGANWDEAH